MLSEDEEIGNELFIESRNVERGAGAEGQNRGYPTPKLGGAIPPIWVGLTTARGCDTRARAVQHGTVLADKKRANMGGDGLAWSLHGQKACHKKTQTDRRLVYVFVTRVTVNA